MTAGQIATRPIRPEECAVAFGIPTSESSYRATRKRRGPYFSQREECHPYGKYESMVLHPYRTATRSMEHSGARIVSDLSLDLWGELFRSPEIQVVILVSHWEKGAVEMHGGFASILELVDRVPPDAEKIVDLTVCQCRALADELVTARPECLVRTTLKQSDPRGAKLDLALWLGLLRALFLRLEREPKAYAQAWEEVVVGTRKHLSRR